jgi:hypothetical protein
MRALEGIEVRQFLLIYQLMKLGSRQGTGVSELHHTFGGSLRVSDLEIEGRTSRKYVRSAKQEILILLEAQSCSFTLFLA